MRTSLQALALVAAIAGCATTTNQPVDTSWDPGIDVPDTSADDAGDDDAAIDPGAECPAGETWCGSGCADLETDPAHCGTCDIACTTEGDNMVASCDGGECSSACADGFWDRDLDPGCEYACSYTSPTEICNGVDDNCNGTVDEGYPCGFGLATACTTTCSTLGSGICGIGCSIPLPDDCRPPAEVCNGIDDDCNSLVDDGFAPGVCDCTPDCTGRECGMDPVCYASCGDCDPATEICDAAGQCQCVPDCWGLECGPDPVCGTSCGTCTTPEVCNAAGACETPCTPDCWGRECGIEPACGTSCGTCTTPEVCNAAGACVASCVPDCTGRNCGPDPLCGTSCGTCTTPMTCDGTGNCTAPVCTETPCGLVPNCGCGTGMKCSLVDSSGSIVRACVAAGTGTKGASCVSDTGCAAGLICLDLYTTAGSTDAACFPFCDTDSDCPGDSSVCYEAFTGTTDSICSLGCNLVTGAGCPSGAKCLLFTLTATGQQITDCTGDVGAGGHYSWCADETSCATGYFCDSGVLECLGYCTITPSDSCAYGCDPFYSGGLPVTIAFDGSTYGYCYHY